MTERFQLTKDYSISRVINGCWQLSEGHSLDAKLDMQDVMKAFHQLVDKGFTTFDGADIYTGVEEFLGKFVNELKQGSSISPHDIQIHTKYVPDLDLLRDVDYHYTEKIIDRSLKRLNRDTLDLVQFHWWDYEVPGWIETAGDLVRLQEKGKIRNIAATNFDTEHLAKLVDAGIPIVSCQSQYSVFDRRPEKALLEYCRSKGIALLCYGTLSGGLLSEKRMGEAAPVADNRSHVKYFQVIEDSLGWDGYQKLLLLLDKIARKHAVSIAHVATKYILSQQGVGATIIGVRNSRHVESNTEIFRFQLDASDQEEIKGFLEGYPTVAGEPFELERTIGSKYRNVMKMNLNEDKE